MFAVATERVMLDGSFAEVHGYGRPGLYGVISVTDTGCGMDEITRQHIFDPFFTTKEVGKGTGLGMAVVYGIIKQHEGYINVYSEPGRGATFRIYLPIIAPGQEADPPKQEVERSLSGKETILLAEDDETVRTITISILQSFGYRVIVAADGEEAVERFQETRDRIDLLLFDLVMPKKTGQEAYEEIARSAPGVKVIFTTGYAPEMVKQREQMDSRVVYAWKPFSPTELLTKVRNVLDARPEAATGSDSGTV